MSDQPFIRWDWIGDHVDEIVVRLIEHVQLTGIAVGVGLLISVPLGIYAFRHRRSYGPITAVTGVLYTIPSLAAFAFLVPYTGLTSIFTAVIPLVAYTLLILIRNVVAGLNGVPEDALEAARGMGYSNSQLLWRVQIPLALPVVIAGIRIATVTTIGLVTVTAVVTRGGMGHFILAGYRIQFWTQVILGATLSVALAVAADALFLGAQRVLAPWYRDRAQAA